MKVIYSGLESSGKSLRLAAVVAGLVQRNSKWNNVRLKEYEGKLATYENAVALRETTGGSLEGLEPPTKPEPRPIVSNLQFNPRFEHWAVHEMGVPIIYWTDLDSLIEYNNADIIIDEVGTYFDSRLWADLSLDVRRWLAQGAKTGIEIYGSAQDFAQVDLAFRRLVNHLFHITKLVGSRRPAATKPPVKTIWGVCSMRELNPQGYKEDKKQFDKTSLFPSFFLIERKYCEIFDTTQKIERSAPPKLKHIRRICADAVCGYIKIQHI